jgi:micrococcal nuclease
VGAVALLCLVVAITDGDTIKVRCPDEPQAVIRLAEIDAPEKAQAFGDRSRQHLAALCFQQQATVTPVTRDRYGRTVAHVTCQQLDASTAQVRAGMAWVFDRYVKNVSLYKLQDEARSAKSGLWADPSPVAPWDWRKNHHYVTP